MTQPNQEYIVWIDDYELPDFVRMALAFGSDRFGYAVTPNVDHLIRYHDDAGFRDLYRKATFVILDSKFLAIVMRLFYRMRLTVCPGSDLTAAVLMSRASQEKPLVLIGGDAEQAAILKERFRISDLRHFNPPFGFIHNTAAVTDCLEFVEKNSPFGLCLLAVGSPQQEILAGHLAARGRARGLALCVGASVDFLTGKEKRAPRWMRQTGFEWLYRLLQNPTRLARRYLVRGPRIFGLLRAANVQVRPRVTPHTPIPVDT